MITSAYKRNSYQPEIPKVLGDVCQELDQDQISISHWTTKYKIYLWHPYFTHISLFQRTGQNFLKCGDLFWGSPSWLCLVTVGIGRECHFPFTVSLPHTGPSLLSLCASVRLPSSEVLSGSQRAGDSITGFYSVALGAGTSTTHPSPPKQIKDFISHSPGKFCVLPVLHCLSGLCQGPWNPICPVCVCDLTLY